MAQTVAYPERLRVVGRILDAEQAQQVEIRDEGDQFTIFWSAPGEGIQQRSYRAQDLDAFAPLMHRLRTQRWYGHPDERSELLRTLGQVMHDAGVVVERVTEDPHGYWILGSSGKARVRRRLSTARLRRESQARQRHRQTGVPPP